MNNVEGFFYDHVEMLSVISPRRESCTDIVVNTGDM